MDSEIFIAHSRNDFIFCTWHSKS